MGDNKDREFRNIDNLIAKSRAYQYTNCDSSFEYANKALKLSKKVSYQKGEAYAKLGMGVYYFLKSDNDAAFPYLKAAYDYFVAYPNEEGYIDSMNYIANIYESYGEYEQALEYTGKALKKARDTAYFRGEADILSLTGTIYTRIGNYAKAVAALSESLSIREKYDDSEAVASSLNRLGRVYCLSGDYDKALKHYFRSMELREEIHKFSAIPWTFLGIATTYEAMGKNSGASDFFLKGVSHPNVDRRCRTQCLSGLARISRRSGDSDIALGYLDEALKIADLLKAKPLQYEINLELAKCHESKGNIEEAFRYFKEYHSLKEEVHNIETLNRLRNQQVMFEIEKTEKEKEIFQLRNVELKTVNDRLEIKNKEITDSIRYAKRLQDSVLPQKSYLNKVLPEHFIFYKPRDIVSGDFYWVSTLEGEIIVVAADSTGHGVPGSLLSMLGASMLDQIVNISKISSPSEILDRLREKIIKALKQRSMDTDTRDGMDISICTINIDQSYLLFSGAFNPLCLVRNGSYEIISADRMPVGIHSIKETPFTEKKLELKKGDTIYLFSDGYMDQFGGIKRKKLKPAPFYELLLETSKYGIKGQYEALDKFFHNWKKDEEQTDDVMVIGIRF